MKRKKTTDLKVLPGGKQPAITLAIVKRSCPVCGAMYDSEVIYNTELTLEAAESVNALEGKCVGKMSHPCLTCAYRMQEGYLLIGIHRELSADPDNPYRSGHIWVIPPAEAIKAFGEDIRKRLPFAFIDVTEAVRIGLSLEFKKEGI